jgi:hypothetical protein
LPFCYNRQDTEQIFDFAKNDLDLPPLRAHSQAALRGHFMIAFLAAAAHVCLRKIIEKQNIKLSRSAVFETLGGHATAAYENKNFRLPAVPSPTSRKFYEAFKIDMPKKMLNRQDFASKQ